MLSKELWLSIIISRIDFWFNGGFFPNLQAWYYWMHRVVWVDGEMVLVPYKRNENDGLPENC